LNDRIYLSEGIWFPNEALSGGVKKMQRSKGEKVEGRKEIVEIRPPRAF
jgi:hypothetical protein